MKTLFTFLFILFGNLVIAQSLIIINDSKQPINIAKKVNFLEDKNSSLSIKNILKEELQSQFQPNNQDIPFFGFTYSTYWVKFNILTTSSAPSVLQIKNNLLDSISLFIVESNQITYQSSAGLLIPFKERNIRSNYFLFNLPLNFNEQQTIYLRVNSRLPLQIPLVVGHQDILLEYNADNKLLQGVYFGFVFLMIFYNLFISFTTKDTDYLLYVFNCFFIGLSMLIFHSFLYEFVFPSHYYLNNYFDTINSFSFSVIINFIFIIKFLHVKQYSKLLYNICFLFMFLFFFVILLNLLGYKYVAFITNQFVSFGSTVFAIILPIYVYNKGFKPARFFLLAWIGFILGGMIEILKGSQLLPANEFTNNAYQIGTAMQMLLFSFALADKINVYKKKEKEAQKENLRLVETQKDMLEAKVKEKTIELEQKNSEMLAQNEELHQQQEELIAVNDNLESKNKLIEAQRAEIDIQIANFEKANAKLKGNEDILKKSYAKLKESESKIKEQNAEMLVQNEELTAVNEKLETTFQELKTTSDRLNKSIKYANQIQQVILPQKSKLDSFFSEHFITYLPKDVVSGDFYWFTKLEENKAIFVLADCTGHGVPGAFMSMIGNTLLHEITKTKNIHSPAEILLTLHHGVRMVLKQEESKNSDGMDISVCLFEKDVTNGAYKVTFSGAKSSIFYIKDSQITQLDGDRISIGGFTERKREFTNQVFTLQEGEVIYFTSDGYIDQHNFERRRFSSAKFRELVSSIGHLSIKEQEQLIFSTLKEHQQKEEQRDDISVVGIRL